MDDSLSIILPAFNEEKNIKNAVCSIFEHVPGYIADFEVIVINDGSTDNTAGIVDELRAVYANLRVASHQRNKGYGSAIRSGIELSEKGWTLIMDPDGQYQISDLKAFWDKRAGCDFVLGFRRERRDSFYRGFMGRFGHFLARIFLKRQIVDVNCGFQLFKKKDLATLSLHSTGNAIFFEILYRLLKGENRTFVQCPVDHFFRKYGKERGGSFRTIFTMVFEGARVLLY